MPLVQSIGFLKPLEMSFSSEASSNVHHFVG